MICSGAILMSACGDGGQVGPPEREDNPFFTDFETPFGAPPFHLINDEHFLPAIEEGMKIQTEEIEAIASNPDDPTFENTMLAMEFSGELLSRVTSVFYNLSSSHTNDEIQAISKEIAPKMSAHSDNISLNPDLFKRVKTLYEKREDLDLDPEQMKLLEKSYKNFVRSGALLEGDARERLKEINSELSGLTVDFGQNVLKENNAFELVIDNEEDLAGLPDYAIKAAAKAAKDSDREGKWIFTLSPPSFGPFIQYAENRELREQIYQAYQLRGNNDNEFDNKENARKMANLRIEKANLLGYETHAHYVLEQSMAKNPDAVYNLLEQLWSPALAKAKGEAAQFQAMIDASGGNYELAPHDWKFYAEKVRKEKYAIDQEEVKQYFSLEKVRDGVFMVCEKLWGLKFEELPQLPVYQEDVTAWEVKESDGSHIGILYMDMFARPSKRGGAWMSSYKRQSYENNERQAPIITINCNFNAPTEDTPSLLSFGEVTTFFHEFGHALHGLLSDVKYASMAGTSVPRDFVELPSQIMENWAGDPEVMVMYAKHYETGEVIPEELMEKLKNSGTFNQGFATTEYLAASFLDLDYHTRTEPITGDINEFESESMDNIGLISEIPPRYRTTNFNHIFAGGYSSGYYSYIWSGVLDTDAYQAFKETGDLFDQDKAQSFRENVLERGGTREPMEMYVDFRGREPQIDALLKKRGLDNLPEVKRN